jgi:hypothetical protein
MKSNQQKLAQDQSIIINDHQKITNAPLRAINDHKGMRDDQREVTAYQTKMTNDHSTIANDS